MKNRRFWDILTLVLLLVSLIAAATVKNAYAAHQSCTTLKQTLTIRTTDARTENAVTQLQNFLRTEGHLVSESSGYFGSLTFNAVKKFQASQGIPAIGIVGPLTRSAIQRTSCLAHPSSNSNGGQTSQASPLPPVVHTPLAPTAENKPTTPVVVPGVRLPYRTESFTAWKGTWGGVSNTPTGALSLKALPDTAGAEAVFTELNEWADYRYTANVIVNNGNITLFARYVDANNFVACNFSSNEAAVLERVNGVTNVRATGVVRDMSAGLYYIKNTSVSMRVKGNTVGCSALGPDDNVTYTIQEGSPRKGGIGIQTWQKGKGSATLELQSVAVEAL